MSAPNRTTKCWLTIRLARNPVASDADAWRASHARSSLSSPPEAETVQGQGARLQLLSTTPTLPGVRAERSCPGLVDGEQTILAWRDADGSERLPGKTVEAAASLPERLNPLPRLGVGDVRYPI